MVNDSFIISRISILYQFCKQTYLNSMFLYCYSLIAQSLDRAMNRSLILNFLKSNWDFYWNPKRSRVLRILFYIGNTTGRLVKEGASGICIAASDSFIIKLLSENFIVLLIYIMFFSIPFLPTMILALICMAAAAVAFLNIVVGEMKLKNPSLIGVVIALFGVCYFYASITSYNFPKALQVFIIFSSYLVMFFLIKGTINTEKKFNFLVNVLIVSALIVALYAIYQYVTGVEMDAAWVDKESFENIKTRAYATFSNPNVLGEYLIIVTSICIGMLWKAKGFFSKCYYSVATAILGLGLITTNSRGAMLGLLLAAGFFVLLAEKRLIIFGIIGLILMPFFLPASLWERLASVVTMNDSSSLYRLSIYEASFNILRNYWISGIGVDAYNIIYPLFSYEAAAAYHSHNLFLQEFIELGVVGFTLFITAILLFFQKLYYGIRRVKRKHKIMLASIFGGFAGVLLQGMVDHIWFDYRIILLFWAVMGLGMATVKIGVNQLNEQ